MKKETILSMLADKERQHKRLSETKKRFQQFNHSEDLARLEGQILILRLILMNWNVEANLIEQ